jgi:2-keto-3-deoxy-L-rhamnonate aldolase RhmA
MFGEISLRKRLETNRGKPHFGVFLNSGSEVVTEISARAGFDVLLLDHEHSPGGVENAVACMNATRGSGVECWVRVPGNDIVHAKKYLDAGADGIMCPMIHNAEEAAKFVSYTQFPPYGVRGMAPAATRHSSYGFYRDEYLRRVRDDLAVLVQIETKEAVDNAEEIAKVDGLNIMFIGPMDLSASLGVFCEFKNPILTDAIAHVESVAKKHNKLLATLYMPGQDLQGMIDRGYNCIFGGGDIAVIRSGMQGMAANLRKLAADAGRG